MHCLLFCLVYFFVHTKSEWIDLEIRKHFSNDIHNTFEKKWQNHKSSIESSLSSVLEEMNAIKGLNAYTKGIKDINLLTKGILLKDNVVDLVIMDLYLRELPLFKKPNVTYTFTSNVVLLETNLEKMIMDSFYVLFRNDSVLLKPGTEQDPYRYSPFSFLQVESSGNLSIVAEDCSLKGTFLTILHDDSVSIGDYTLTISDCKFYIEIFSPGSGSPPIIAPYFTGFQKYQLQSVMASRICQDFVPKLEGALITFINPVRVFGMKVVDYCIKEKEIVASTRRWLNRLIKNINKLIIKETSGQLKLKDYETNWNETKDNINYERLKLSFKNVTIYGLDTAYSANKGGPFKLDGLKIMDTIKFSLMQMRGILSHEFRGVTKQNDFTIETKDFSVKIELDVLPKKMARNTIRVSKFEATVPRITEFSIVEAGNFLMSHSLVNGYITDMLPEAVQYIFFEVIDEAISATLHDKNIDLVSYLAKQGLDKKVKLFSQTILNTNKIGNVTINNAGSACGGLCPGKGGAAAIPKTEMNAKEVKNVEINNAIV